MTQQEKIKRAICILKRKTTIPGDGYSFEDIYEAIDFAIAYLEKDIPKKPIKQNWSPNLCPTCKADLGGKCNDGYYENPRFDRCPECNQKLDYDD